MSNETLSLNEQQIVRRENLQKIIDLGFKPYPAEAFYINMNAAEIKATFKEDDERFSKVRLAGRLMSKRVMGKASFAELQDASGRIQMYVNRDEICPDEDKTLYNEVFKKLLDLGDIVGIEGYVFLTKTNEITVHVNSLKLLSKSIRPLPVVKEKDGQLFDAFSDPEQRYRQRYLDLIVNPTVRQVFQQRAVIVQSMRNFLINKGYLEVETPGFAANLWWGCCPPFQNTSQYT